MKYVKIPVVLLGSGGDANLSPPSPPVPASITHGNTGTATLLMPSALNAGIGINITWTGSLTTAPTITPYWSPDGVNFFKDNRSVVTSFIVATGSAPTGGVDLGPYEPPPYAKAARLKILNGDGTTAISVFCVGSSVAYSVGY